MINKTQANELNLDGYNVHLRNNAGWIVDMPDRDYRAIKAHSKSGLTPALRSGLDYEHFTVKNNAATEKTEAMSDSSLLHCLTLEKAEFEKRYLTLSDVSAYKDHPLFFETKEALKAFISRHNKDHSEAKARLDAAVKQLNAEAKKESKHDVSSITYESLPVEFQNAEINARSVNSLLKSYEVAVLSNVTEETLAERLTLLEQYHPDWTESISGKLMTAPASVQVTLLNDLLTKKAEEFLCMEAEEKVEQVPLKLKIKQLKKSSVTKCVNEYVKKLESMVATIDTKAPLIEQYESLPDSCKQGLEIDKTTLHRLYAIGVKHPDDNRTEVLEQDALDFIERAYGLAPVYWPQIIDDEKALAIKEKKESISKAKVDHAQRIVDAVYDHPKASFWLTLEGNFFEAAMFWNHPNGDLCKAKLDIGNLQYNVFVDLKFVRSTDIDVLDRDFSSQKNHLQHAMYKNGGDALLKEEFKDSDEQAMINKFVFIAVEKDAPKLGVEPNRPIRIRVEEFDDVNDIERASDLLNGAINRTHMWQEKGSYDDLPSGLGMQVPPYQRKQENALLELMAKELAEWESEKNNNAIKKQPEETNAAINHDDDKAPSAPKKVMVVPEPTHLPSAENLFL